MNTDMNTDVNTNEDTIYCAFDKLNPIVKEDETIWHACEHYGTYLCSKCDSKFDGERVKKYMVEHPKNHE